MNQFLDNQNCGLPKQFFEPLPDDVMTRMAKQTTTDAAFLIIANHLDLEQYDVAAHMQNPIVHLIV